MAIVKEGIPFIVVPCCMGVFVVSLLSGPLAVAAGITLICIGVFCAFFFRDPRRAVVVNDAELLAPADGTVMEISEEGGTKTVRIFLSVFNVHLQRSPCAGTVKSVVYVPGKCLPAMNENAHIENEQNVFTITTPGGDIVVRQIAGIIARRVVSWVKPGEHLAQGQKIGFIKFGSQVNILMPSTARVTVREGEKIIAGKTVVAVF